MILPDEARLKRGRAAVISCQRADCDICLKACGFSAISRDENGLPSSDPNKCVGCGGCAAICPDMAVRLLKDRGDGTYELTFPLRGELPEIDDMLDIAAFPGDSPAAVRVIQAIPQRPNTQNALVRAVLQKGNAPAVREVKPKEPMKMLVIVDMQKDFVDGSLGTPEAVSIVPAAAKKAREHKGPIFVTLDTHGADYLDTREGRYLPVPHCIEDTPGFRLGVEIESALFGKPVTVVRKNTFGSTLLPELIKEAAGEEPFSIELIGLCTDICVISNALILKAAFPEADISVDARCCAGVTPEKHDAALLTMESCQIKVIRE